MNMFDFLLYFNFFFFFFVILAYDIVSFISISQCLICRLLFIACQTTNPEVAGLNTSS